MKSPSLRRLRKTAVAIAATAADLALILVDGDAASRATEPATGARRSQTGPTEQRHRPAAA